jgi:hypothetical protein
MTAESRTQHSASGSQRVHAVNGCRICVDSIETEVVCQCLVVRSAVPQLTQS